MTEVKISTRALRSTVLVNYSEVYADGVLIGWVGPDRGFWCWIARRRDIPAGMIQPHGEARSRAEALRCLTEDFAASQAAIAVAVEGVGP